MGSRIASLAVLPLVLVLSACQGGSRQAIATVEDLDLPRFMGDWYVIANIPTFLEKDAHNAVESYQLTPKGTVATTFTFRDGGFDGPVKTYRPTGFVSDDDNAVWGMQFIWPIKAEFLVLYVDDDYQRTIIGRSARDYVWLMAREPEISETAYHEMIAVAESAGYDVSRINRVPQQWSPEQ
jgi:apolipoprotein D and lipocalin family protein